MAHFKYAAFHFGGPRLPQEVVSARLKTGPRTKKNWRYAAPHFSVYTTKKWGDMPEIISPRAQIQECRAQNVCRVNGASNGSLPLGLYFEGAAFVTMSTFAELLDREL